LRKGDENSYSMKLRQFISKALACGLLAFLWGQNAMIGVEFVEVQGLTGQLRRSACTFGLGRFRLIRHSPLAATTPPALHMPPGKNSSNKTRARAKL
jgi:hypothetical protein